MNAPALRHDRTLTPRADRRREMPCSELERELELEAALESLRAEQRRLERLGFEEPLRRCHEELRYWNFVAALHALPGGARS